MPEQLGLSSRAIIGRFYQTLEAVLGKSWMTLISMLITSNQESETYKWLGQTAAMDEWKGKRRAQGLRPMPPYTLINKIFDATLDIDIDDLRRDKTGQVMIRVDEMAARAAMHWEKLGSDLILAGETALCYDGLYFFAANHAEGDSGTQKNLLVYTDVPALEVTTTTAPTPYEMAQAILGVIQYFYTLKDDLAEPINGDARSFMAMVPVPFWGAAVAAMTGATLNTGAGSVDNPLLALSKDQQVNISVIPNPRLSAWTTSFAVFRTDGRAKPLIMQEEYGVQTKAIAEGSEMEKNDRKHRYIVEASRNAGYGYWQHAMKATFH
jgi:phage major head subunit gpT-like protein